MGRVGSFVAWEAGAGALLAAKTGYNPTLFGKKAQPGGLEWRGSGPPESGHGRWYDPTTGESFHPNMDHDLPKGPHWDYKSPGQPWEPLYPDVPYEQ